MEAALVAINWAGDNQIVMIELPCSGTTPDLAVSVNCPTDCGLFNFSGSVTNQGNVTLTNVMVFSSQSNDTTLVLGPISLAPGASAPFTGSYIVPCVTNLSTNTTSIITTNTAGVVTTNTVAVVTTNTLPVVTTNTVSVVTTNTVPVITTNTVGVVTTNTVLVVTTNTVSVVTTNTVPVITTNTVGVITTNTVPVVTTNTLFVVTTNTTPVITTNIVLVVTTNVSTVIVTNITSTVTTNDVNLGTANNFAVLASSAVTSTGPTVITGGNLGLQPDTLSSVTGFSAGNGTVTAPGIIEAANGVTLQAQNDLTTAYNTAAGLAPTQDLTGQDLGGMTLTPGVYHFDSSAQLTGTLTLDDQGNPDAVFVFQIGSTLTTASGSSVVSANDPTTPGISVYWQVGSSATLGTGTDFEGNILAKASITDNGGSTVVGRLLAETAAVTLNDTTINVPPAEVTTNYVTSFSTNDVTSFSTNSVTSFTTNDVISFTTNSLISFTTNSVTSFNTNLVTTFSTNSVTSFATNLVTSFTTNSVTSFSTNLVTTFSTNLVTSFATNSVTSFATNLVTSFATNSVTSFSTNLVTSLSTNLVTSFTTNSVTSFSTNLVTGFTTNIIAGGTTNSVTASGTDVCRGRTVAAVAICSEPGSQVGMLISSAGVPPLEYSNDSFKFSFASQSGVSYTVQYKCAMADPTWTDLDTVTGTGGIVTISKAVAGQPTCFYRIKISP